MPPSSAHTTNSPVLVGSNSFMADLRHTAIKAKNRFFVQAMTFESDAAGQALIQIMRESTAKDRRLCYDDYSRVVVNDRMVWGPSFLIDASFRKEVRGRVSLTREARKNGIGIKITNPSGPLLLRYPFRNHKKMAICDNTVYLGGLNFSDHNFSWHDMMVRLDDPVLADFLAEDFNQTFHGGSPAGHLSTPSGEIFSLNQRVDPTGWQALLDQIRSAKSSIRIYSPYVSDPLLTLLEDSARSGIEIDIITPSDNNKSLFKKNLLHQGAKGWYNLYLYAPGMSHLKALLIDDSRLITGSSNFDFASCYFEDEVVLVTSQTDIINAFQEKIGIPMKEASEHIKPGDPRLGKHPISSGILRGISGAFTRLYS